MALFAKIIKLLINVRLTNFLTGITLVVHKHYEFLKNKSIEMALFRVKEKVISNTENKLFTVEVFLDLSEAFDSIKHDIRSRKLPSYRFRASDWN